jgi:hypothetical protein
LYIKKQESVSTQNKRKKPTKKQTGNNENEQHTSNIKRQNERAQKQSDTTTG